MATARTMMKLELISQNKLLNTLLLCDPEVFWTILLQLEVDGNLVMKYESTTCILAMVQEGLCIFFP